MSFLQYLDTPVSRYRAAPSLLGQPQQPNPRMGVGAGIHPAVVSYLSGGSPLRQSYSNLLVRPQAIPGQTAPPGGGPPVNASPYIGGAGGVGSVPNVPGTGAEANPFGGPGSTVAPTVSYMDDPILQQVLAQQAAALKTVRGNAVGDYEDLLLGFGSQQIARDFLGKLFADQNYADAAGVSRVGKGGGLPSPIEDIVGGISDNPDTSQSTLGRIQRALNEATRSTDNNLNGANLFFSGTRGRALRDLNYENQGQVADATQALRQALTGITRGVTGQEQSWQMQVLAAEEAVYTRQLTAALANTGGASGSSGSGGSSGGGGAQAATAGVSSFGTLDPAIAAWMIAHGYPVPH